MFKSIRTRLVVWVWKHTPTCAEMSRLASQSLDQPVSLKIRFRMCLHYLICIWCERYYKHLKFVHRAASQFPEQLEAASNRRLSAEARQRIVQRLQAAHHH